MVQHNRYSVSIKQIGEFLSKCLKEKYQLELMKSQEIKQFPATIELQAIMDKNRLNDITNNKCLEKMTIKGNLSAVENIKNSTDINLPIFNINDSISNINGYEFTLTITANKTREKRKIEYDSIDQSACKDLYNAYANVDENKDNIDVTIQYQNNSDIREVLTWSSPLKESFIEFSVDSRKEIDFRELCRKMESVLT